MTHIYLLWHGAELVNVYRTRAGARLARFFSRLACNSCTFTIDCYECPRPRARKGVTPT